MYNVKLFVKLTCEIRIALCVFFFLGKNNFFLKIDTSHALYSQKPPFRARYNNELESIKNTQLQSREQRWILSAIIGSFWIEIVLWCARQHELGLCIGGNGKASLGVGFTFVRFLLGYAVRSQSGSNAM